MRNAGDIASIPCFTQSVCLVVNKNHPLANRKEISLAELGNISLITYRDKEGPFAEEISSLLSDYSGLTVSYDYNDEITLCSLVVADQNIMAIACHSWLVDAFPEVVPITIKEAPIDFHTFYISYRNKERRVFAVDEFVRFMKNYDFGNASPHGEDEEMVVGSL